MLRANCRLLSCSVALLAGLALAGVASAQSTVDRAKKLNEVAAQKIEQEVRDTLVEVQKQTDAKTAVEMLKKALTRLEQDDALSESRRNTLIRVVKDRIRSTEAQGNKPLDPGPEKPRDRYLVIGKKKDEPVESDKEAIARGLKQIAALKKEGKYKEANKLATELAAKYPDDALIAGAVRTTNVSNQVASAKQAENDKIRNQIDALRNVDKLAMAPKEEMEFPKNWKEMAGKRSDKIKLTQKEQAILKALDATTSANFKGSRFEDVIDYLSTLTNQPIIVDKTALDDQQINYDTPVNCQVKTIQVRTLLRKILGDLGLTYVVKDEVIYVTSVTKAKDMLVTRVYYIGDFASGGMFGNALQWGVNLSQLQMLQNVTALIELIQANIEPSTWAANNGAGSITFHAPSMSLIVRQSAEVHAALGGLR